MNEEQFEKTERFVQGKMNKQESLKFEAELQRYKDLAAYVEAYQMIDGEMQNYDKEAALKDSLQNISAGFFSQDNTSVKQPVIEVVAPVTVNMKFGKNNLLRPLAVAAVLIVIVGVWYFVKENNTS